MRVKTFIQRTAFLLGLVAIVATSVNAQGPSFGDIDGWPSSNPFNPNPNNNNGDSGSSNGGDTGSGGTGTGSGSGSDSDSGSGNGDGGGNNNNIGGGNFDGSAGNNGQPSAGFGSGLDIFANEYTQLLTYRTAHGALAALAFAFLFPLGAIVMRVVPGRPALLAHGGIQVLAYALYVAAAGLGLYLTSMIRVASGADPLERARSNAHPIIGIALLVLLFSQPVWGVMHHRLFKKLKRRTPVSHVHLWVGRLGITLGIINGGLGLALAGAKGAPVIAYSVVAGVMWLLWVLATLFATYKSTTAAKDRQRKMEKIIQEDRGYVPGIRGGRGEFRVAPPPAEQEAAAAAEPPRTPDQDGLARPPPAVVSMDIPSPPYEPGPHYQAHMANVQQQRHQQSPGGEPGNSKEDDRYDSVSIMSASPDEMHRGQV
ncbi:hypothetical protein F5Y10DRAFT_261098 [Nemania abortiva]|nr:hypothetical protein F5Y10DRAFT_261098 [Nemania abortiva]